MFPVCLEHPLSLTYTFDVLLAIVKRGKTHVSAYKDTRAQLAGHH